MRRLRFLVTPLFALGVLGCVAGLSWQQVRLHRRAEQQVARAVLARLDGQVSAQLAVVAELADRFGRWEGLPRAALAGALRSAGARHPDLVKLVVADRAGRILASWDATQPLGREGEATGRLDGVLGRRQVLAARQGLRVGGESQAGRLRQLWVAAAILRPDGTRPGYVAGSLHLPALRRGLLRLVPPEGRLAVQSQAGARLLPCGRSVLSGGESARSDRFRVTVALPRTPLWPWVVALTICLAGLLWWRRAPSQPPVA